MTSIQFIVGTVMGTAQGVAEYCQKALAAQYEVSVNMAPTAADLSYADGALLVFCTSNTGTGDLPENILPVYQALISGRIDMSSRNYGLINLGDSSYPTYGLAGHRLNKALRDHGAQALCEMLTIDANVNRYPQKLALEWVQSLINIFERTTGDTP